MAKEEVFWAAPINSLYKNLKSSEGGLSSSEAKSRLKKFGLNEIKNTNKRTALKIFFSQFKNAFVIVLIFAALIALILGDKIESVIILSVIILNSILGFFQEYKAENTIKKLREYIRHKAKVLRDNCLIEINSQSLVPGDVVYLHLGDIIPADMRLIHAENLSTNESSLTGESTPSPKTVRVLSESLSSPQSLTNMIFAGTSISEGDCIGIVVSTGESTFFGKTALSLKEKAPEEEFQKGIRHLSNLLLKIVIVMTVFIFLVNAFIHQNIIDSLLFSLALAVGITPEILPVIVTVSLSHGALRMAKHGVIIKKLSSMEDFGNIDTLCCDKTGTLTEGKISLVDCFNIEDKKDKKVVLSSVLCNSSTGSHANLATNYLDKAILESKDALLVKNELKNYEILHENEFDFERRRMSVIVKKDSSFSMIAKGAPEFILPICTSLKMHGRLAPLSKAFLLKFKQKIMDLEKQGYKVILIAEKKMFKASSKKEDEKNLSLLGYLVFLDPPKSTSKEALQNLMKLGVSIKVLTGDSPVITRKTCHDVGLEITDNRIITGEDLSKLSLEKIEPYVKKYNVFARLTPQQKRDIVKCLNQEGHIVGFLGDGVNDAPALNAADVGISVSSASDISKDAADIILLHKSLDVLAKGITEGRKTFGNVTKYIMNTVSANYGNMITVAVSSLFMKFIPLLPSQILLNNFLSDVPNLSLPSDNVDREFLRKPKKWNIRFISKFMVYFGILSSIFDLLLIIPLLVAHVSPELFRTAWFTESLVSEVVIVFAIRTTLPFYKNRPGNWLILTSIATIILAAGITLSTIGSRFFGFTKMPLAVILLISLIVLFYFITAEFFKRYFFRKFNA